MLKRYMTLNSLVKTKHQMYKVLQTIGIQTNSELGKTGKRMQYVQGSGRFR